MTAPAAGHVVEARRGYSVCLTCGRVGTAREAITHAVETFLRSAS